jgi:Component of IIS longevity pathway SMK-1
MSWTGLIMSNNKAGHPSLYMLILSRHVDSLDDKADNGHGAEFSRRTRLLRNHVFFPNTFILISLRAFINVVRDPKANEDGDDEFADESLAQVTLPVSLPPPAIGNLDLIDNVVQQSVMTQAGRESLVSFIHEEVHPIPHRSNSQKFLYKLVDIFHECEDIEDLDGLHHLSSIMKTLSIQSSRCTC